jgi:hypothetical protein
MLEPFILETINPKRINILCVFCGTRIGCRMNRESINYFLNFFDSIHDKNCISFNCCNYIINYPEKHIYPYGFVPYEILNSEGKIVYRSNDIDSTIQEILQETKERSKRKRAQR